MVVGSVAARSLAGKLLAMGTHLTKRRAVDLCRVTTCLCRPVI
ncbi:Ms5788A family Cys-rich leader peptide [Micromonospora sp. NBC_01638]